MTLPVKSILSCLLILATASDIHTQQMQESGGPDILVVSNDKTTVVGDGVEQSQLPVATFSPYSNSFDVSVYIRSKKQCNFGFRGRKGSEVDVKTIKQLGGNIVVFAWYVSAIASTIISIFDMGACSDINTVQFNWQPKSAKLLVVVPFINGFDVITSDNSRTSYKADGNLIGTESFPINSDDFFINAVSKQSPPNFFFIVDCTNKALNRIKIDGTLDKHLLSLNFLGAFSNSEQSLYSICAPDADKRYFIYRCFQYDEYGTEKWHNKVTLRFRALLDVKNLPGGGLVFAAFSFDGNQLSFVKMGPKQTNIWRHTAKQTFFGARLMDFSEKEHAFVLAYDSRQIKEGILEETVALQKYSLIS